MNKNVNRRNFLQKTALTAGLSAFGSISIAADSVSKDFDSQGEKLPREVWIASISQMGMTAESSEEMVEMILQIMSGLKTKSPDIICLPEVFATSNINKNYTLDEKVQVSLNAIEKMSAFSKSNSCYIVCPVYTSENGAVFNSAVIIDRQGKNTGEYHKIHLTEGEISMGLTPGNLTPPVFETDFGTIGVQICFDLLWDDGWKNLRDQGAEIVFLPSAFPGGQMVNAKAWQHKYVVVSSTRKHTSKICDITGAEVYKTGIWNPGLICAPVNLEKAFLHLWPYVRRFPEIQKKYGRDVRITIYHEEEWAIIECLSSHLKVKDILAEFELRTHEEHVQDATIAQKKARNE